MEKHPQGPVVAAIVSAVAGYMALEEEEAQRMRSLQTGDESRVASASLWAVSGRQSAMDMRRLLQMRMVR